MQGLPSGIAITFSTEISLVFIRTLLSQSYSVLLRVQWKRLTWSIQSNTTGCKFNLLAAGVRPTCTMSCRTTMSCRSRSRAIWGSPPDSQHLYCKCLSNGGALSCASAGTQTNLNQDSAFHCSVIDRPQAKNINFKYFLNYIVLGGWWIYI